MEMLANTVNKGCITYITNSKQTTNHWLLKLDYYFLRCLFHFYRTPQRLDSPTIQCPFKPRFHQRYGSVQCGEVHMGMSEVITGCCFLSAYGCLAHKGDMHCLITGCTPPGERLPKVMKPLFHQAVGFGSVCYGTLVNGTLITAACFHG